MSLHAFIHLIIFGCGRSGGVGGGGGGILSMTLMLTLKVLPNVATCLDPTALPNSEEDHRPRVEPGPMLLQSKNEKNIKNNSHWGEGEEEQEGYIAHHK